MNQFDWRKILTYAGILGLLAGVIPMFLNESYIASTIPIATMMAVYLMVPRLQERRFVSALVTSVLTAVIAMFVYFIYAFATQTSGAGIATLRGQMWSLLLTILFVAVIGSFVFVKTHEWTEKKRKQMDEKAAVQRVEREKAKGKEKRHYKIRSKRKYKKKK